VGRRGSKPGLDPDLVRRFNGSTVALSAYCQSHPFEIDELNKAYLAARDRRTGSPAFHKLAAA
jgi:hypothetical protein